MPQWQDPPAVAPETTTIQSYGPARTRNRHGFLKLRTTAMRVGGRRVLGCQHEIRPAHMLGYESAQSDRMIEYGWSAMNVGSN
jgi:hypothetical protein